MNRIVNKFACIACLAALLGLAQSAATAATLFEQAPAVQPYGIQADASTGPLVQQFDVDGGSVERVLWWGFHGANSLGAGYDLFEVHLDGDLVTGTLTASQEGELTRYSLQLTQAVVDPLALSIWNNSDDVEWFWQSVSVGNDDHAAFALEGIPLVPEPGMGQLMLVAFGVLLARRAVGRRAFTPASRLSSQQ